MYQLCYVTLRVINVTLTIALCEETRLKAEVAALVVQLFFCFFCVKIPELSSASEGFSGDEVLDEKHRHFNVLKM